MKAFIIYQRDNEQSVKGMNGCASSLAATGCDFTVEGFDATTPQTLHQHLEEDFPGLTYTYPRQGEMKSEPTYGLTLTGYVAKSIEKKFACTVSHARLWKKCCELNEEIMILEHDAYFTRKFEPFEWEGFILGLNDPRGATRRAGYFHEQVSSKDGVQDVPWIDNEHVPQGLAGNSAYLIKPFGAAWLLGKLDELGAWPNDALMCKQICPWLKVVYPYYTSVQGMESFTTR